MRFDKHTYTEVLLLAVLLLTACTEAAIYYPENTVEPPANGTEGYVRIYPDNSVHTGCALTYHFYNTNTDIEYIVSACDGVGNFEGMLPIGTYRVIATNTDALNVTFSGMQGHTTAAVTATVQPTRSSTLLAQPSDIYSSTIGDLTVSPSDTVRYDPVPVLLTRTLNLVFTLMDGLEVSMESLSGTLYGVYPSVYLYSREPLLEGIDPASQAIIFEAYTTGKESLANLRLFGLYDPAYGETYTSVMELVLVTSDGIHHTFSVDLTETLSEIIAEYGYELPIELSLPITIRQTEIGISAGVSDWFPGGDTEIDNSVN